MSSVVHTWQSWQHVLQPRTPWHQPPVKHLIVPCVAQEHNHTCSSGSSKHGKPTSSPLHVLGFQRCRSLSQHRWKTSNYSNRHNFHEIRSIQETSCHPNPPFVSHFTILIKDMCIGFTRKNSSQGPMMASDAPVQSSMGCHLETCWNWHPATRIRLQGTQGMEGVQGTKTTVFFGGKISIKNYLINLCVIPKKNIYIYM